MKPNPRTTWWQKVGIAGLAVVAVFQAGAWVEGQELNTTDTTIHPSCVDDPNAVTETAVKRTDPDTGECWWESTTGAGTGGIGTGPPAGYIFEFTWQHIWDADRRTWGVRVAAGESYLPEAGGTNSACFSSRHQNIGGLALTVWWQTCYSFTSPEQDLWPIRQTHGNSMLQAWEWRLDSCGWHGWDCSPAQVAGPDTTDH